jgi:hypothetical protein
MCFRHKTRQLPINRARSWFFLSLYTLLEEIIEEKIKELTANKGQPYITKWPVTDFLKQRIIIKMNTIPISLM